MQRDNTFPAREGKRGIEHLREDFEQRRANGNGDRHRERTHQRESAVFDEHAHAKP